MNGAPFRQVSARSWTRRTRFTNVNYRAGWPPPANADTLQGLGNFFNFTVADPPLLFSRQWRTPPFRIEGGSSRKFLEESLNFWRQNDRFLNFRRAKKDLNLFSIVSLSLSFDHGNERKRKNGIPNRLDLELSSSREINENVLSLFSSRKTGNFESKGETRSFFRKRPRVRWVNERR